MSDKMEQLIRLAAKEDLTPPKGLEERTMRKIEQRLEEKKRPRFQMVLRPAVALLLLAAVCLAASPAIAKYRPIAKYFSQVYKNNKETEKNIQEYCVTVDRIEENKKLGQEFPHSKIKITPKTVLSDGFVTYVVVKVEGIHGFKIKENTVLNDERCEIVDLCNDIGSATDCYLSDRDENALYYTMSLLGTQVVLEKELVINLVMGELVRAEVDESGHALDISKKTPVIDDGKYTAELHCKVSKNPGIRYLYGGDGIAELPYGMRISPLGIHFQDMSKSTWNQLMHAADISVLLEDGRKIPVNLQDVSGAGEYSTGYCIVSSFDDIISDTADIRYLVLDGEKYDLKKIEKQQKQK